MGRYALHFHLSGTMNGSYIRNCAIHHSNNRALTAHGVHNLLVEGNVAYDIKGHAFFVVSYTYNVSYIDTKIKHVYITITLITHICSRTSV